MTTAPQINLRDGSGSATEVVFTTNQAFITLEGTVDTNAVDIQVSIDGAAFVSDSTLVELDGVNFTVPNPSSYPDGLPLQLGSNSVRIRSIDIVGSVSPIATASITRVAAIEGGGAIPTGIKTRRRRSEVDILIAKLNQQFSAGRGEFSELAQAEINNYEFQGFNVYASTSPGGTTGYFKINENIVTERAGRGPRLRLANPDGRHPDTPRVDPR
jgi:hypothetical protein